MKIVLIKISFKKNQLFVYTLFLLVMSRLEFFESQLFVYIDQNPNMYSKLGSHLFVYIYQNSYLLWALVKPAALDVAVM